MGEEKFKIRLQRIHKAASRLVLEYFYRENNVFICRDIAMNAISHEEFVSGKKKYKVVTLAEKEFFKDIEVTYEEKAFLSRHPFVKFDGNPNMNNCTLEMIDVQQQSNKQVVDLKKRNEVFNIINNLDVKEVFNLCNYLGLNVSGKDMNDIFIMLLNNNDGVAYENYDKVKLYEKDADALLKVIINKALILGRIEKHNDGFYFGNKIVAASLDELYFYCKNNEEVYETGIKKYVEENETQLMPTIQYSENFIIANKELRESIESKKLATVYTDRDREWAMEKVKELGIKGFSNPATKTETIIAKILTYPTLKKEWEAKKEEEREARKVSIGS